MYTGASAQAVTTNFQHSQDTLYALAGDTGGKALLDNNDLARGIVQAQQAISDYYIIGYYTSEHRPNGKFRRIRISLANDQEAKLDYRQGYYANKEFSKFNDVDKERQLEDALMLGDPITDLTIAMEIDYFQLNRAEYFVPIIVKIPGRELALAKRGGAEHHADRFHRRDQGPGRRHHGQQRARQREHQADRRDRRGTAQAPHRIRHRIHAAARKILHQVPGARR